MASIALVLLMVGVAVARHISFYDDESVEQPMVGVAQERRICAELCMSGLGGAPCGSQCRDVAPSGLPTVQSAGDAATANYTRRDACPVLCANRLGYPLCSCEPHQGPEDPFFRPDYVRICAMFCVKYDYQIYGCPKCEEIKKAKIDTLITPLKLDKNVDWNAWCLQMCSEGDGGAACYCDLLPMSIKV